MKNILRTLNILFLLAVTAIVYLSFFYEYGAVNSLPVGPGLGKHFLAYTALSTLASLIIIMGKAKNRRLMFAATALVVFSGAIELVQPIFERSANIHDFFANVLGILGGVILAYVIGFVIQKIKIFI